MADYRMELSVHGNFREEVKENFQCIDKLRYGFLICLSRCTEDDDEIVTTLPIKFFYVPVETFLCFESLKAAINTLFTNFLLVPTNEEGNFLSVSGTGLKLSLKHPFDDVICSINDQDSFRKVLVLYMRDRFRYLGRQHDGLTIVQIKFCVVLRGLQKRELEPPYFTSHVMEDISYLRIRYNLSSITRKAILHGRNRPLECPICYQDFEEGKEVTLLQCSHAFHEECIALQLEKRKIQCPYCRRFLYE